MRELKDETKLAALEHRIAAGEFGTLVSGVDDAIASFTAELAHGYAYAAQRAAKVIDADIISSFRFDIAGDAAVEWMRRTATQIADGLIHEQEQVAARVVRLGTQRGLTNRELAEQVQASIGLNAGQVEQVERYRVALEQGDYARALSYELRDARYDAALERQADLGGFMGEERIDAMVSRYRDNWIAERADSIALGEAQNASHAGVEEAFEQAVGSSKLAYADLTKTWITRADKRVRTSHRTMHGQTRQFLEPFTSGAGVSLRYPGDEDAPGDETANCRCVSVVQLPGGRVGFVSEDDEVTIAKFELPPCETFRREW